MSGASPSSTSARKLTQGSTQSIQVAVRTARARLVPRPRRRASALMRPLSTGQASFQRAAMVSMCRGRRARRGSDRAAQAVAAVAQIGVGHCAQPGLERERMRGGGVERAERGLERGLLVLGERAGGRSQQLDSALPSPPVSTVTA